MQVAYKEKVDYIASIKPEIDAQREEVEEAETRSKHLKMQLEDMSQQAKEHETAMQEMAVQLAEEKIKAQEVHETARTVRLVRLPTDRSRDGEDEEAPRRRRKRGSAGSTTASDSGFESDLDAESIFSASGSTDTPLSPPDSDGRSWNMRQPKGRAGGSRTASGNAGKRLGSEGAAWATVETLRGENRDLKRQMEETQRTLQGCIDLVSGVGNA